jgi:hypothetical protein
MITGNALRDGLPRSSFSIVKTSEARMRAERRQRVADGGQTSLPWLPSRSVIDSVGTVGEEFARIADPAPGTGG